MFVFDFSKKIWHNTTLKKKKKKKQPRNKRKESFQTSPIVVGTKEKNTLWFLVVYASYMEIFFIN